MAEERWRPVPDCRVLGVPAGFEASTLCRVRSPRGVLTPTPDKDGYLRVRMGRRLVLVSVAVCLAFHGRPEARHLNGNREDNRPENLAWGSHWDNGQDWIKHRKEKIGQEWVPPVRPKTSPRTGRIGLRAAVSDQVVTTSLAALRLASRRDPLFPEVTGMAGNMKLYDAETLFEWSRLRHSAGDAP